MLEPQFLLVALFVAAFGAFSLASFSPDLFWKSKPELAGVQNPTLA